MSRDVLRTGSSVDWASGYHAGGREFASGRTKIEARRSDIVFIDKKERKAVIIVVAIPGDDSVKDKELEKVKKYQLLKDEIAKVWHMRKIIVVPVVIGALGAVSVIFKNCKKQIGVKVNVEVIQRTALIWTAKILRKEPSL